MQEAHLKWIQYLFPESSQKVGAEEETSVTQAEFSRDQFLLWSHVISINCLDAVGSLLVKSVA